MPSAPSEPAIPAGYLDAAHIAAGQLHEGEQRHPKLLSGTSNAARGNQRAQRARANVRAMTAVRMLGAEPLAAQLAAGELTEEEHGLAVELARKTDAEPPPIMRQHPPADMEGALRDLGVDSATVLSDEERATLDRVGFVNLGVLLDPAQIELLRSRFDSLVEKEKEASGSEVSQSEGIARLSATVLKEINDDGELDLFFCHPRLLSAVSHVLGRDFKLSSSNFHAPLPGGWGHQGLHAVPPTPPALSLGGPSNPKFAQDFGGGVPVGEYQVCNALWCLDEFTEELGATRVVPGLSPNPRLSAVVASVVSGLG